MDKPNRERTIIVNVNGEQKEYKWISTAETETFEEIASSIENEEESAIWLASGQEAKEEPSITMPAKKKLPIGVFRLNKVRLFGMGIPVVVALLTGTIFGLVILRIVLFGGVEEQTSVMKNTPVVGANVSSASGTVYDKSWTTFVVQGGVYSTKTAAEQRGQSISEAGVPYIIMEQEQKYYIYIGTAGSLDQAKQLAKVYKEKGVETYPKEISFQGSSAKKYTKNESTVIKDLLYNQEQYNKLVTGQMIGEEAAKTSLRTIKKDQLPAELSNIGNLNESMKNLWEKYQTDSKEEVLLQIQKCTLEFLNAWKDL